MFLFFCHFFPALCPVFRYLQRITACCRCATRGSALRKVISINFSHFYLLGCLFCTKIFGFSCGTNHFMLEYAKIHSHTVYFFFVHFFRAPEAVFMASKQDSTQSFLSGITLFFRHFADNFQNLLWKKEKFFIIKGELNDRKSKKIRAG